MKVVALSANLGSYDIPAAWAEQVLPEGVSFRAVRLTDADLPPRPLAMTSRLMCGIPKWFGPDFAPEADVLLWVDASCALTSGAVAYFLEHLGGADLAAFRHPERANVREEFAFLRHRMARPGERYLTSRYAGEWFDDMEAEIESYGGLHLPLYATTAFAYRPLARVLAAFRECFLLKARYCLHDQMAFPYVLAKHGVHANMIPDNYLDCPALRFTRKAKRPALAGATVEALGFLCDEDLERVG